MYNSDSSPIVTHCSFMGNSTISLSGSGGGGMYSSSSPTVTNCIFWGDYPNEIAGGTPTVSFSNVQDGWEAERNIDAHPMFVEGYDRKLWMTG